MNRRDFVGLGSIGLLATPKTAVEGLSACQSQLNLSMLIRIWAKTARFEMHPAQWAVYSMMTASVTEGEYVAAVGMCGALPVSVNPDIPKDEVRLVAFDGTVMSKITGLAIPNGF